YFGQGAALLRDPAAAANPFYAVVPQFLIIPMVILATAATIIASQAVITGLYSLSHQAALLDYLPRLRVIHTSATERGQIYLPGVNWVLMLATMGLVAGFQTSDNLASAYGIAVMTTMICTSVLLVEVAVWVWKWPLIWTVIVFTVLIFADANLFSAALMKVADGGWFPLVLALIVYTTFITWRRGRELLRRKTSMDEMPLEFFVENVTKGAHAVKRVPGTAVFLNRNTSGTPRALGHNIKCNKVLHETVIVFSILVEEVPHVSEEQRVEVKSLGNGLYRVFARYGFMESPDVIDVLRKCSANGLTIDIFAVTFFVGREVIVSTAKPGMARWREHVFAFLTRNAAAPTTFFNVPPNQTVEFGLQVEM
ncbi:MAG: KUP/HAK/KT family potassium transporter, partial [Candidatus Hydrogenedentota bacterium]